jgi:hypothetical protein
MQSRTRADALGTESLARLHRPAMEDPDRIRSVLERARDERVVLDNGIDGLIHSRGARIAWIADDRLGLDADYIDANRQPEIYFTFELDGRRYFFAATAIKAPVRDALEIGIPPVIYERECRDLPRTRPANSAGGPCRVELRATDGAKWTAEVLDQSYEGLGIALPAGTRLPKGGLSLVFLDGDRDGERAYAEVRHLQQSLSGTRIGLWVTQVPPVGPIPIERRPRILEEGLGGRMRRRLEVAGAAGRATMWRTLRRARRASESLPHVEVVEYPDDQGRPIRALVNRAGDPRGGTAVVVPPAWGRTKETLLPLAEILVRTFERAGEPPTVVLA